MIDHEQTPSGWWDVVQDAAGTWRADYHHGDELASMYGFVTREEACLATWDPPKEAVHRIAQ